ncbi:MAG: response regulator [Phycisphaerales bacterium]|nr:response regulator [Phycisphaerales bacterium]
MRRVLIVDDDGDYLEQMVRALSWDATASERPELLTAGTGRDAIAKGVRYQPHVLIIDWMLRDQMHGLHVTSALRAVHPQMQTILITGFVSQDLQTAAERNGVFAIVEKPFELEDFRNHVRSALDTPVSRPSFAALAIIEVGTGGDIRYANTRARELFNESSLGDSVGHMRDLFEPDAIPDLAQAVDRWVSATPRSGKLLTWNVRTQPANGEGSRLVVIQRSSDPQYLHQRLIELLLGAEATSPTYWSCPGRVLVVDGDAVARRMAVSMLEAAGAGCYTAATHDQALRLFDGDEDIQFVVLDANVRGDDLPELVRELQSRRPSVILVGNGDLDKRAVFESMGIEKFLLKPWRGIEFVDLFLDT